ncbi:M14 family zinc carboxypeptidase [Plantibacter sp. YIM 135249]|uniref:M14 family zinc carboxypeptidase n=1 Tax=Plantibacter sp. YIM 135249 TaxID=3423918 RepID=UPI003D3591CB
MTFSTTSTPRTDVGSPEDILRRAGAVPHLDGFPPVDELSARMRAIADAHPALVTRRDIATSRLGEAIECFTIGRGANTHLIVGGVHPNEPIGSWTAIHLLETLVDDAALLDALDATWHIVPCIDPDGARLNEAWYPDPADRNFYGRHFYRPAPNEQIEWSFPTSYKLVHFDQVLPETAGLMRLIDELEPDLYVSLHNGEMGGVYYYLSRPVPALTELLHAIPASLGLPLDGGEPESPHLERFAEAIFGTGTIAETYDYYEGLGVDPTTVVAGSSSSEYAHRHGTLSLIAELPYWSHPDANDQAPSQETYGHLMARTADAMGETGVVLTGLLERATPHLTLTTPFRTASEAFVPIFAGLRESMGLRASLPESARSATIAEVFSCEDLVHCFRLRYGGMLLRAFEAETAAGTAPAELRRITEELLGQYEGWQAEPNPGAAASVIPVASLVGVQYGAVLAAAAVLVRRPGTEAAG